LKIEQLSLAYKVRIGVKTPAAERAEVKILWPSITHTCVHIMLILTAYLDSASKDPKIDPSKERKKKTKVQPSFNSRIKVAVRLRPKTTKEEAEKEVPVIFVDGSNIQLLTNIGETFFFHM
jgi:hypothetical protein